LLKKEKYNRYFSRQIHLIGRENLLKLKKSKALVVGAGGLGCNVSHQLANNGIGLIGIMDGDKIALSNLHRQKNYQEKDIGLKKTSTLIKSIKQNNPFVDLNDYPYFLTQSPSAKVFKQYDVIIDCTDNQEIKYLINDLCIYFKKPLVFGAIQQHEGQVSVLNFNNGPTLRCAFPYVNQLTDISCEQLGTMDIITSTIASMQVVECLNLLLKKRSKLNGNLLHVNVLDHTNTLFKIKKNSTNLSIKMDLNLKNRLISANDFDKALKLEEHQFIDLRKITETPKIRHKNLRRISVDKLKQNMSKEDMRNKIIVFCQSGKRSSKAIKILEDLGYENTFQLKGGINSLTKQ